jgi:hypothetical protein
MSQKTFKILGITILLVVMVVGMIIPTALIGQVFAAEDKPTVSTSSAGGVSETNAVLQGQVNPNGSPTSYWFEYGATQSLGSRTSVQAGGVSNSSSSVVAPISGLTKESTYYFRVVVKTSMENRGVCFVV